jgi:hypothetical protein
MNYIVSWITSDKAESGYEIFREYEKAFECYQNLVEVNCSVSMGKIFSQHCAKELKGGNKNA